MPIKGQLCILIILFSFVPARHICSYKKKKNVFMYLNTLRYWNALPFVFVFVHNLASLSVITECMMLAHGSHFKKRSDICCIEIKEDQKITNAFNLGFRRE